MPTNQGVFDLPVNSDGTEGKSKVERLKTGFPNTPCYLNGSLKYLQALTLYNAIKADEAHENTDFAGVSTLYAANGAPLIAVDGDVPVSVNDVGDGLPATPFAPNVASPIVRTVGETFSSYSDVTTVDAGGGGLDKTSVPYGSGDGFELTPHAASRANDSDNPLATEFIDNNGTALTAIDFKQ